MKEALREKIITYFNNHKNQRPLKKINQYFYFLDTSGVQYIAPRKSDSRTFKMLRCPSMGAANAAIYSG